MVLERISSPADLRALGPEELLTLADELRTAIVSAVARSGGHLGSNLGVVELTIALHRVFDSPRDRIVWDTGHQAYVHKMLTGRAADFESLRTGGGLSGYPSRAESDHDLVENSHASTALSWVAGLAWAELGRSPQERRRSIAVVGDGALTGGMAYEALNNIGHHSLPVTVVLNDNGRSYAETVSRLPQRITELRTDPRYRRLRGTLDRINARLPWSRFAGRVTAANFRALKTAVSEAPALQGSSRRSACATSAPSTAMTSRSSSVHCGWRHDSTRLCSSTSSPRRARATGLRRRTRRSACTTRRPSIQRRDARTARVVARGRPRSVTRCWTCRATTRGHRSDGGDAGLDRAAAAARALT
jgi:transketolase N-terminal domain/subunit